MVNLVDVPAYARPTSASRRDPLVGRDELGREIRMARNGVRYLATDVAPVVSGGVGDRGAVYNLLDNIIGYDDDVVTPGERLKSGVQSFVGGLLSDPLGTGADIVRGGYETVEGAMDPSATPMDVLGAAGMAMGAGGLAARPAGSVGVGVGGRVASGDFGEDWSNAYHWTRSFRPFDQFDPDISTSAMSQLGPHVGTRAAAEARASSFPKRYGEGEMMELRADVRRPFLNPRTNEPWSETGLEAFISQFADEHGIDRREAAPLMRRMLANEGFTDIPYINDIEDADSTSNIMLVDRPSGSDAVLRRTDAAFDPDRRTDPNLLAANRSTTAGLLATQAGADTPSQQIARLLREGRGAEVTDDLYAAADPQELHRLYEGGTTGADMPMDTASRMARADDMGLTSEGYHGTTAATDFQEFVPSERGRIGPGVYFSPNERLANVFAGADQASIMGKEEALPNARVIPVRISNAPADEAARFEARALRGTGESDAAVYQDVFGSRGFDGVSVEGQRTIVDPSNIRSRFARFDPRLAHLRNLNAANVDPTLGLLATQAGTEQDPLANLRNYVAQYGLLAQ